MEAGCVRQAALPGRLLPAATAADEVNYLDAVAFRKRDLRPFGAPDYFHIQFDGNAFGGERKRLDETL